MESILEFLSSTHPATILFLVGIALVVLGLVSKIPLGKDRAIEMEPESRRIALVVGLLFVAGAIVWMVVSPPCSLSSTPPCPPPTPTPTETVVTATSTITPTASSTPTLATATATSTMTPTEPGNRIIDPTNVDLLSKIKFLESGGRRLTTALSFAPSSARLAVGLEDGSLQIWQIADDTKILEDPDAHDNRIRSLAFSPPTGTFLASGSWDTTAKLWRVVGDDLSPQHTFHTEQTADTIQSVAFSPSGLTLATGLARNQVYLFSVSSGDLIAPLRMGNPQEFVTAVTFSADGSFLAAGSSDGMIQVWKFPREGDPESRPEWVKVPEPAFSVRSVAFSPVDNTLLASGHSDGSVRIWNAVEGRIRHPAQVQGSIRSIAFSPDGTILAVATQQGNVYFLDGSDLSELGRPLELSGDAPIIAFSPEGTLLAVGSPEGVSIWGIGP